MCSGVKSLRNHRKLGGAFRTNLTKAFCGTGMLGEAPNSHLPQQDSDEEALYCNEQVYGKFTVLQVTGIVNLE
jgi:hypothetical protein